jgi:hypothetical protein
VRPHGIYNAGVKTKSAALRAADRCHVVNSA